ncbi:hypothetical protein N2152v2_005440 [Parachlorella kessleri]
MTLEGSATGWCRDYAAAYLFQSTLFGCDAESHSKPAAGKWYVLVSVCRVLCGLISATYDLEHARCSSDADSGLPTLQACARERLASLDEIVLGLAQPAAAGPAAQVLVYPAPWGTQAPVSHAAQAAAYAAVLPQLPSAEFEATRAEARGLSQTHGFRANLNAVYPGAMEPIIPTKDGSHQMLVLTNTAWTKDCLLTAEGSRTPPILPPPGAATQISSTPVSLPQRLVPRKDYEVNLDTIKPGASEDMAGAAAGGQDRGPTVA